MDQVRLDALDDLAQAHHQLWHIPPTEFALSARPLDDFHTLGHGAILRLPVIALQANVEHIMSAISNCREKAVVVGGVAVGEIDDPCHVSSTTYHEAYGFDAFFRVSAWRKAPVSALALSA